MKNERLSLEIRGCIGVIVKYPSCCAKELNLVS